MDGNVWPLGVQAHPTLWNLAGNSVSRATNPVAFAPQDRACAFAAKADAALPAQENDRRAAVGDQGAAKQKKLAGGQGRKQI